jgi:hypothetical protein
VGAVKGTVGAGAGAGGPLAGPGGAARGAAAKTLVCAAVAGSAGSAGYVAVHEVQLYGGHQMAPATASRGPHAVGKGAARGARAARAVKPIVAPAAPVVIEATTEAPSKTSRAASGERDPHGKRAGGGSAAARAATTGARRRPSAPAHAQRDWVAATGARCSS